jgi:site-specific recombinase XerD
MNNLQITAASLAPELGLLAQQAAKFIRAAKASSTRHAYATDLADFQRFAARHALPFLPSTPGIVALYISDLASRLSVASIRRRMVAIRSAHREAGYIDSPASPRQHYIIREVLAVIKRTIGVAQKGAESILGDAIRQIVNACPQNLLGARDRALKLLGFAADARRSELVSIMNVGDLTFTGQRLLLTLTRTINGRKRLAARLRFPSENVLLPAQSWLFVPRYRVPVL